MKEGHSPDWCTGYEVCSNATQRCTKTRSRWGTHKICVNVNANVLHAQSTINHSTLSR
jgi:hypothetical protein